MLVSIALTAAIVCKARTCTKRLDEMQWPILETKPTGSRPRHVAPRPRRDPRRIGMRPRWDRNVENFVRDETEYVSTSRDCLETETSRPRPHPWINLTKALRNSQL